MTNQYDADGKLDDLLRDYLRGKIDRRQFLFLGAAARPVGERARLAGAADAGAGGQHGRQ